MKLFPLPTSLIDEEWADLPLGKNINVKFNENRINLPIWASSKKIRRVLEDEDFDEEEEEDEYILPQKKSSSKSKKLDTSTFLKSLILMRKQKSLIPGFNKRLKLSAQNARRWLRISKNLETNLSS